MERVHVVVDRAQDRATTFESLVIHSTWQLQILDRETATRRVGTQAERSIRTGQIARAGKTVRLADGKWHHVLASRIEDFGQVLFGLQSAPQAGSYLEEVISEGPPVPPWNF